MKIEIENKFYKTSDLYIAAYLVCCGCIVQNLEALGNKYLFVILDDGVCGELEAEYWQDKGLVNPKRYSDIIRSLKSRIYLEGGDRRWWKPISQKD